MVDVPQQRRDARLAHLVGGFAELLDDGVAIVHGERPRGIAGHLEREVAQRQHAVHVLIGELRLVVEVPPFAGYGLWRTALVPEDAFGADRCEFAQAPLPIVSAAARAAATIPTGAARRLIPIPRA